MPHMAGTTAAGALPSGIATMRPRAHLRKPAIVTRRLSSFIVRAAIVTFMSFAVAFGFLAGATSPAAHYDPYMFAIGVASLFGAACGAIAILIARIRRMRAELRELETRLDEAADRNWGMLEAQDALIVGRGAKGSIGVVNDPYCGLDGRIREDLVATAFTLPVLDQSEIG